MYSPVLALLRDHGCTIRQMPCPELAFGGTQRFWAVREQYDTPVYRAHCRRLAEPVAAQIRADLAAGARVIIVGIDGSPSMGVELTAASEEWGGRPDKPARRGLSRHARDRGSSPRRCSTSSQGWSSSVRTVGIGQDLFDYDEASGARNPRRGLERTGA